MPFPVNAKGTPQAQVQLLVFGTHAVDIRTKMHTIRSSNMVQGSQGMTRKKRSPPHMLRCQVWQSTGASTDIAVNTHARTRTNKRQAHSINTQKRDSGEGKKKKRAMWDTEGISLPSQRRQPGGKGRANAHVRKYAFEYRAKSFPLTERHTYERTKTNVNFQSKLAPEELSDRFPQRQRFKKRKKKESGGDATPSLY